MRMTSARGAGGLVLLITVLLGHSAPAIAQGQQHWTHVEEPALERSAERRITPSRYQVVRFGEPLLRQWLTTIGEGTDAVITLPDPDGGMQRFSIERSHVMHPDLARRYPMIQTFTGTGIDAPGSILKLDITPNGLHAMVLPAEGRDWFIDPLIHGDPIHHQVYRRADLQRTPEAHPFCGYEQVNDLEEAVEQTASWVDEMNAQRSGDCQKRIYRLALACTAEYASYHGSNTTNNSKAGAMAAMVTTMNRVNGVFERDVALTMVLVASNDQLIYLNAATDPYTNGDAFAMLGQNQTTCNNVIGAANYDIGHVFATGGGGVATLNSPCTNNKARGVTGRTNPTGDPFDIDYVAHEMAHQFGANHTQNNGCQRSANAAFEPGSGSTILGYAGVCSPNVQSSSDAMFHGHSMMEMAANITVGNSSSCPQLPATSNVAPVVNAGADHTIPRGTPFLLAATASDANSGKVLSYSWEQMNNQVATQPPLATNTEGPAFRTMLPSSSPQRYFPALSAVLSNSTPTWEVLPTVGRTMNFRVNVRDNVAGAGCTARDDVIITVAGTAGPFVVTQPNTNVSWASGSSQTITWNVAGTTAAPVNCASVDILLSVDGGQTWPHVLVTGTANDGSQSVDLPSVTATSTARIMVKANGNVFHDISDQNFTITGQAANIALHAGAFLEGPYVAAGGLMHDILRQSGLIPLAEPYTALGYAQVGGGGESTTQAVLNVTGGNAIVDWVRLELRSASNSSQIVATRQALIQRDGDIVGVDGTSAVTFAIPPGNYFVVVRHRNHLGCMTASPVALSATPATVNFRLAGTSTHGTDARKAIGNIRALWAGNVHADDRLSYTGQNNDRDPILQVIGGVIPTATTTGYLQQDVDLDGVVKYTGANNDRDVVLVNIGGVVPTSVRLEQVP